jgi:uncharacterized protein (TIGR02266 family)
MALRGISISPSDEPVLAQRCSGQHPVPVERRRHPRFPLQIEISHVSEHNFFTGFTEDISEGGLFIATYNLFEIGHRFELEFVMPGQEQPCLALCEVRWIREYNTFSDVMPGMGVRFLNLPRDAERRIQRFIRQREPLFYLD